MIRAESSIYQIIVIVAFPLDKEKYLAAMLDYIQCISADQNLFRLVLRWTVVISVGYECQFTDPTENKMSLQITLTLFCVKGVALPPTGGMMSIDSCVSVVVFADPLHRACVVVI